MKRTDQGNRAGKYLVLSRYNCSEQHSLQRTSQSPLPCGDYFLIQNVPPPRYSSSSTSLPAHTSTAPHRGTRGRSNISPINTFLYIYCSTIFLIYRSSFLSSNSNLSRKVARLMDSFRPGATSYCPFENKGELVEVGEVGEVGEAPAPATAPVLTQTEEPVPVPSLSPEEQNRRRLYLNEGRPRPFYRVSALPEGVGGGGGGVGDGGGGVGDGGGGGDGGGSALSPAISAPVSQNKVI